MPRPDRPKIYHIIHLDRLPSVLDAGSLLCDAEMANRAGTGTVIGMNKIKLRRLTALTLTSHPGLFVGQCVPFYFCPRSVMLYLIHMANDPDLSYKGGQDPIVHVEADLRAVVSWAEEFGHRWAFTLSNAGSYYFEDRRSLDALGGIDWAAVEARKWSGRDVPSSVKDGKQAEFLLECHFPWHLVTRIGTKSRVIAQRASDILADQSHRPTLEVRPDWYY